MTTVASTFGHSAARLSPDHPKLVFNACMGIELEIEDCQELNIPMWDCKEDGSLRNGCEMVCSAPYSGEALHQAIEYLSEAVTKAGANGSWRCSTHVHLDVRDCDANVLKKLILAWAFYERMLFKCSGYHRYRSNFCPAFAVVQGQVFTTASAFNHSGERFFNSLVQRWDKYTSLNLLPMRDFGSVEFRISEPKWKRTNLINLVNRFLMLKKLAVENSSMTHEGFVEYLREQAFTPMVPYLPLDYDPDQTDLNLGYQIANDILNVRRQGVTLVNNIREQRMSDGGEMLIPARELGHWDTYSNYLRGNWASFWNRYIRDQFQVELNSGEFTETRLRQFIDVLTSEAGQATRESNVYRLIPEGLEGDLRRFLRDNG